MQAKGQKVQAIENKPALFADLQGVWNAFMCLHRSRGVGFVPNPISMSDLLAYFELFGPDDPDERMEIAAFIWFLDDVFLKWAKEKSDANFASRNRRP